MIMTFRLYWPLSVVMTIVSTLLRQFRRWLQIKKIIKNATRVCVCVCVCVLTSIHCVGFICLNQVGYQRTDQRCYVEEVNLLCQVPSSIL